ncbi:MAG: PAS domain S-box protein [Bernardetiaceae bacterium]|nr:PAS domain S-box protein [Bernardetiaceae bacterium]
MVNLLKTKQIKDFIEESPEKLQEIINGSEYGICITNEKGFFVAVNDNYTKVYGYAREELVGESFLKVVPTENKDFLGYLHDQFIEAKKEISRTWEVQRKNGDRIKINVDARFTDAINNSPHKITFVQPQDESILG